MARDESNALGGYYKTPVEIIPAIAALCKHGSGDHYSLLDPCAADGEAAVLLSRAIFGDAWSKLSLYCVELESSRARKLLALSSGNNATIEPSRLHALQGDAFAVEFGFTSPRGGHETIGASVILGNWPYHNGLLEHRFTERFTEALRPGGVLIGIVPFYSLDKSADTIARNYNVIGCFKFPEPLFSQDATRAFKQVVLYAVRRAPLLDPDPVVRARIVAWSQDAASIPVLPEAGTARPIVTIPGHPWHRSGFAVWRMRPVDTEALLARFRPFHVSDRRNDLRPVPGMVPPPASELLCRNYPVATPLKPAHIATAIAAGVFNGAFITADDPDAGWPDMLVKGCFDREFVEIDEKVTKDGEKTASIRVQQPKLRVTVLDLREGTYHTLVDSDEESAADTVARITTADLLAIYGQSLLRVMLTNCPALHDPARDGEDVAIADLARPLYKAQAHTVRAMLKVLGADRPIAVPKRAMWKKRKRANAALFKAAVRRHYHGKAAILLGECGAGKSSCALATTKTIALPVLERGGQWRTLVVCPPHLLKSWRDQTAAVTPEARVVYLSDIHDVDRLAADTEPGMVIAVLSREVAKLGHAYDGIANTRALLVTDSREGFGVTAPRRARAAAGKLVVRRVAPDGEVWATIEESADGERWTTLATFDEMLARGEQTIAVTPAKESLYTRVTWSSASDASFGIYDSVGAASTCPQCGIGTPRPEKVGADHAEELARKRIRCPRKLKVPASVLSRAAKLLAEVVYAAYPHAPEVSQLLTSRGEAMAVAKAAKRVPDIAAAPTPPDHYSDEDKADYRERARVAMDAWQRARVSPRLRYALDMVVGSRCRKRNHHLREGIDAALRYMLWAIGDDALTCSVAVKLYKASIPMSAETYGEGADLRTTARGMLLLVGDEQMQRAAASQCTATGVLDKTTHYYSGYVAPWTRWDEDAKLLRRGGNSALHGGISCQGCEVLVDGLRVGDGAAAVHAIARLTAIGAWDKLPPCDEPLYEAVADPTRGGRRFALSKYIARRHPKLFDLLVLDECFVRGTMVSGRPIESLQVGDEVDAYDEATRTMVKRRVVRLYRSKPTALVRVHVRGMEPIVCTPNHPFLCSDGWEIAWKLQAGVRVRTASDAGAVDFATVERVEVLAASSDGLFGGACADGLVYNIEVEGVHTYTANGVIVHNCHEASNSDAAQSRAMWRLAGLKMPVIAMTGTAMGGYAEQLWAAQIALDPQFGDEFARDEKGAFVDRYGYVKVQERDVDKRTGEVVAYGSASDRVTREVKILGNAPGVLPLFLLRYLLRIAPVLHKADLKLELPPCREIPITVAMTPALAKKATHLYEDLKAQIKMDRFDRVLAGKLFGALAHLATEYPLLASADTGNAKGRYEIRYPDNRDLGIHARELVVGEDGIDASEVLPIEAKTIEIVRAELAEGRRCMVLATSAVLNPRLRRLLEEALREPVALLDAKKVDTSKREQWILDNCVTPDVRVLVVNPEAIQTGLNPLVHFSTEVWLQNPGCKAVVARQAIGRVDRIGQKADETRIYFLTYDFGPNQAASALWHHKIAVSLATDGLDAGGALAAAGVGDSDGRIDGFGVGRLIFEVMSGERTFKPRKHVAAGARKAATTAPKGARKARGAGTVGAQRDRSTT